MGKFFTLMFTLLFAGSVYAANENNYAAVWHMNSSGGASERAKENIAEQSAMLLDMWRKGIIENVYMATDQNFDQGGSFVFFIKANNEEEAAIILDEMPFVKNHVSDYQLFRVGKRWLGRYEVNN